MAPMNWLNEVKWDAQGLVPVIAQEQGTGDVLMFACCLLYTSDAADE